MFSTIVVEPHCHAFITECGDVRIHIEQNKEKIDSTELDLIRLSIFQHRFMSIAEQCGRFVSMRNIVMIRLIFIYYRNRVLQLTSISTNIKERLDFSCAVFGPDGGLVANAPHIPVHLGAMQEAVQYQVNDFQSNYSECIYLFFYILDAISRIKSSRW